MTATVAIRGLAGIQHARPDGGFQPFLPRDPVPPKIKAGDRLHVRLEVGDEAWIYAIAMIDADYLRLGAWGPASAGGLRMLWPGGRVLGADDGAMDTLVVVASSAELPWARDLTRRNCADVIDKMPADPPVTPCDHLYGLIWKAPRRPRGLVPPVVDFFDDSGVRIPAIVAEHRGSPYTAIEWQFKPRT